MRPRHPAALGSAALGAALVVAVALVALVAAPGVATAQNAEAELLFRDGDKLMATGDVARACEAFEASNRIEARAGTLIRLGDCREKNGQLAAAWSAYSDALSRVKDPKKREIAQARVAALEPRLSQLTISVPDESRVPGLVITRNGVVVDAALWNRGAPVDGGEYVVAGRAPGHEEWSTKVLVPMEAGRVSVEVPRFKALQQLTAPPPGPVDDGLAAPAPADAAPRFTPRRKLALGVAGGAAVVLLGAAVVGRQAQGLETDAHDACATIVCDEYAYANEQLDQARGRARLANIGYGIAAGAGIAAGVLWFTGGGHATDAVAVRPAVAPGSAGAVVQGRF